MTEIKRYQEYSYGVEETVIGEFVKHEDHTAIVAAKDARIAELASREQWHSQRTASFDILNRKYIDLQEQVRELAAENVLVREQSEEVYAAGYNHGHLNTADGIAYAPRTKDDFYPNALQVMAEVETPATEAVLREIRAQAVELAVRKLQALGDDTYASYELECLANSIRAGEQQ